MPAQNPVRVLHVIPDLLIGGTEVMLVGLVKAADRARISPRVVSMLHGGELTDALRDLDVPVSDLGMSRALPNPMAVLRLARMMRRHEPDVVQTWMPHGDLVGGLAACLAGRPPVVWGIRQTNLERHSIGLRQHLVVRACARLSRRLPVRILCNAAASRDAHVALGYDAARMEVVPNGFDTDAFRPDPAARLALRRELGLAPEIPLIGLVANFTTQKDHGTFARAAGRLVGRRPEIRFVLCGTGIDAGNEILTEALREAGVLAACHLLGQRKDIAAIHATLDVATSSSTGEGMANAIGEAMACGIACVVTDVGDQKTLVGDTGLAVPPRAPDALADAWEALLTRSADERAALGSAARARIAAHYSLATAVARYQAIYLSLART